MLKKRRVNRGRSGLLSRNLILALFIGAFAIFGGSLAFKNSFAEGSYTVYFRNGATRATFNQQTVAEGASPYVPGAPSTAGYTFADQYQSSTSLSLRSGDSIGANTPFPSSQISDISVNSNLTLYSVMTPKKYNITTVMTGNVPPGLRGSVTTHTYGINKRVNLPSMSPYAKNGYTFEGWNSEVAIYNNSWFYMPTKNIRVVGTWKYTGSSPAKKPASSSGDSRSYSAQPSAGTSKPSAPAPTSSSSSGNSNASASSSPTVSTPKTGNDKISAIMPNDGSITGQIVCLGIIGAIITIFLVNHRKKLSLRSR